MRFIERHIVNCVLTSLAEARGEVEEAARLHAQAKLRLICMSDNELHELAEQLSSIGFKEKIEETYIQLKCAVATHKENAQDWMGQLLNETPIEPFK